MTAGAQDALGAVVPVPDGVDAEVWRRFAARVIMLPGGCHMWTAPPRDDGYGQVHIAAGAVPGADRTRIWRAHRFAYAAITGERLDAEVHLLHRCDQPLCVPITAEALAGHIEPGDNLANVADRERRGRGVRRGRHGMPVPSRADRRGQAARSQALHQALAAALAKDSPIRRDRAAIAARLADVDAAGEWDTFQPALPFEEPIL